MGAKPKVPALKLVSAACLPLFYFFYFVRSFFFLPVPRHLARHCWRLIWVYILLSIVSFSVSLAKLQAMLLPISASHPDLQVQFRFLAFFFFFTPVLQRRIHRQTSPSHLLLPSLPLSRSPHTFSSFSHNLSHPLVLLSSSA